MNSLPLNQILNGDCVECLATLPEKCVDVVFADPPYNLQLSNELLRPNQTLVDGVDDEWDKFTDFADYDAFTRNWLLACRRVLKDDGTLWVIGSYHNIYRVGAILMDLGYWILNDVHWFKTNPMPNFRGTRFTNATETMLWAKKSAEQKRYTFNYHAMKHLNDETQMQNVWQIPLCTGEERLKIDGHKAHPTQKPKALLYRVLASSSNPGDVVLDPFFGSGTTGAVAKKLGRCFIGVERDAGYIALARQRIDAISPSSDLDMSDFHTPSKRTAPRVGFGQLVEMQMVKIGQVLYSKDRRYCASVKADGFLNWHGSDEAVCGSIHKIATLAQGQANLNGWEYWYYENENSELMSIDALRDQYRREIISSRQAEAG